MQASTTLLAAARLTGLASSLRDSAERMRAYLHVTDDVLDGIVRPVDGHRELVTLLAQALNFEVATLEQLHIRAKEIAGHLRSDLDRRPGFQPTDPAH